MDDRVPPPIPTPAYGTYSMCAKCPYKLSGDGAVHGVRTIGGGGGNVERMTPRQRIFIAHYLQCLNATEAARRAGYKDGPWLRHFAHKLTTKSHIRAAIDEGLAAACMTPAEVIARIEAIARGSMGDFLDIDESGYPRWNFAKAKERGALGNLKTIRYDANGKPAIELYDRLEALGLLAKIFGLTADKHVIAVVENQDAERCRKFMRRAMADPVAHGLMMQLGERLREVQRPQSEGAT
jgi:hypothetical protein